MAATIRRHWTSFLSRCFLSNAAANAASTPSGPSASSSAPLNSIGRLKSAIRAESDPERILALFQSSTHLHHFYRERPLYQMSVHKLARSNRRDLVERLLESQKSDPAAPKSEGFFIRIMSLYTEASMPSHAVRTFEQIPERTEHSLCALLTIYLKKRRYDHVIELFKRIPRETGIEPGVAAYNILLSALCETAGIDTARKLLDELPMRKDLQPNIISYNTILTACLKYGDEESFDDILKEIERKVVAQNVVTYNLRMSAFCKRMKSFKAEELLETMASEAVKPNLSTLNTLVNGFCKEGDLESALRVFKRLKVTNDGKEGVLPCPDTYVVLLRGLVYKGNFTSAQHICQECLMRGFAPPFAVMKALVIGLVKDSKFEEAEDLVDKMRKVANGQALHSWKKFETELPL
ncbi:hypothetical protein HPP92_005055 [Vanilla planifolia]|uniref:Pentatricopeptide repeat-containing protein n=1 Tax=Vanilla planifolia TaxID=51239 RepID=A0A835RTN3_VANPL|nr:hypothetical protein HPP92_005055 [Vanilla planifolia]